MSENQDPTDGDIIVIAQTYRGVSYQFMYSNVTDIRVHTDDRVVRGQVIARAWLPSDNPSWLPSVHLEYMDANIRLEQRDPLKLLSGCLSKARDGELVYPIPC